METGEMVEYDGASGEGVGFFLSGGVDIFFSFQGFVATFYFPRKYSFSSIQDIFVAIF